jgi:hypothetical protein
MAAADGHFERERVQIRALTARQPEDVQKRTGQIFGELTNRSEADLYILKSLPDVCLGDFDCHGVPGNDVKSFVEAALSHLQTRETTALAAESPRTAKLSFIVSITAFVVSFAGLGVQVLKKK